MAGSAQAASTLAPEPAVIGSRRADRHGVAQPARRLRRGDADAVRAVAAVELHALAGDVAQPGQHRGRGLQQRVDAAVRELGQRRPGPPAPVRSAVQQSVHLQPHREAVRGGAGQAGAGAQLGQPARLRGRRAQHPHGFVEYADAARLSHEAILTSRILRCRGDGQWYRATTLAEKVWDQHLVRKGEGQEPDLLYIDLHLVHEVTSPQAFDGLRLAGRPVRRPDLTVATEDHNVPTLDVLAPIADPVSRTQVETLRRNCAEFGVPLYPMNHAEQGIVHVVGPQLGLTQPGLTVVCGDSHTSTHGAFGAMAFGIGTSEVEHVLATQTLPLKPFKTMAINVNSNTGRLRPGVTSKDVILAIIAKIGTGGGQGYVLEYRGNVIENLSMEARMTICNMSIEAGARAGMIAPDETTFAYLKGRDHAPKGADWDAAVEAWRELRSDDDAVFDAEVDIDADTLTPFVTWGTNPGQGLPLSDRVPDPEAIVDENERVAAERALEYMGLEAGTPLRDVHVDTVFVGSCTNGRIEDLRSVAEIMNGRKVADGVRMLVVPGSMRVRFQAEEEGLDKVFTDAGAEWRSAGCSMCLGMNPDQLAPGERSASTSNRNFEGRQGKGGRTHLVSPLVAAATAVRGTLSSPEDLN